MKAISKAAAVAEPTFVAAAAAPEKKTQRAVKAKPALVQLDLFGFDSDPVVLAEALEAADRIEAATAAVVAQVPALAAQLEQAAAKENLDFARFMRSANTPHEAVHQVLAESTGVPSAAVAMEQLAAVERAEAASADAGADDDGEIEEIDADVDVDHQAESDSEDNGRDMSAGDTKGATTTSLFIAQLQSSRYAPMTPDREAELGRKSMAGDMKARTELIERNMRFMVSMARRFIKTGRPFDDLIQAGSEGLMTAAAKFNPELGRFTTVAAWWIRQAIQRAVRKDDNMPIPAHLAGLEAKLLRQAEAAGSDEEREKLKTKAASAAKRLEARRKGTVSLDQSVGGDEDGGDMLDLLASEEVGQEERAERMQLVAKIAEFANRLGDARATNIFMMRVGMHPDHLGDSLSLGEIGEEFDLTRERVRQIYTEAANDIATAMEFWAKGAENLPDGFRKSLMHPGRT